MQSGTEVWVWQSWSSLFAVRQLALPQPLLVNRVSALLRKSPRHWPVLLQARSEMSRPPSQMFFAMTTPLSIPLLNPPTVLAPPLIDLATGEVVGDGKCCGHTK
jgi:hypothetical protein